MRLDQWRNWPNGYAYRHIECPVPRQALRVMPDKTIIAVTIDTDAPECFGYGETVTLEPYSSEPWLYVGIETLQARGEKVGALFDWGRRLVDTTARQPELFNEGAEQRAAAHVDLLESLLATLGETGHFEADRSYRTRQAYSRIVKTVEDFALSRPGDRLLSVDQHPAITEPENPAWISEPEEAAPITEPEALVQIAETEEIFPVTEPEIPTWIAEARSDQIVEELPLEQEVPADEATTEEILPEVEIPPAALEPQVEEITVSQPDYPVDINSASLVELETIPGLGYILAHNIITYRDEHGLQTSA